MKKIDGFIDCYDISKTLRFKAIPVGKTQENIAIKRIIEEDEQRSEDYKCAKKLIDRYHKAFIQRVLSEIRLDNINEYYELYIKTGRTEKENDVLIKLEDALRKEIADAFKKDKDFKKLFGKECIKELMPDFLQDESEKKIIQSFDLFTTAFTGFNENRKNIYSAEKKASSIGYRCINENLPRFISNIQAFKLIRAFMKDESLESLRAKLAIEPYEIADFFSIDFFNNVLSQQGINIYNALIGGLVSDSGEKIQGLNEYINLYNQKNKAKVPKLKALYNQVLSDLEKVSFYADGFNTDEEVLMAIRTMLSADAGIVQAIGNVKKLFEHICEYDKSGIYIKNGPAIPALANEVYGSWSTIQNAWNNIYDEQNMRKLPKKMEVYVNKRRTAYKKIESFSVLDIEKLADSETNFLAVVAKNLGEKIENFEKHYELAETVILGKYSTEKNLVKDVETVALIKNLLDAIKEIERYVLQLAGTGKELRDESFYGELIPCIDAIREVDFLYDRVRNYVTQKPFSKNKFKLYFQNPQFMNGWDKNKEPDYRATMLFKDGKYYLAVIDKQDARCLQRISKDENGENYRKLDYKLISGASKSLPHVFFVKSDMKRYGATDEVLRIYEEKTFTKGSDQFSLEDCHKIIDYYKSAINQYSWGSEFDFRFSPTSTYKDVSGFFKEVDEQGYRITFDDISASSVNELVENGMIYLFQIYNKDFSEKSHGTENLHTMYFKMIFDPGNNGIIRLCGGAKLFLRRASLKKNELVVHPAGKAMENKNPLNPKKQTVLEYDICKDRRFSEDQYEIHLPIVINKCPHNNIRLNHEVRRRLKYDENPYVIGIDRGERNLLYICVIDGNGKIVEQFSLNEIVNEVKGIQIRTDYHRLLEQKESERLHARQNWTTVENIKELKEGYISQVVHKICELVVKYDAVIALEDLNSGFKNSRVKVEKQVYQKFEKMLIDKLNYMTDKKMIPTRNGGVLRGYQLANRFESFKTMGTQNGIMFYIPAWLTSKIDPATGFVNLLKTKYVSVEESKKLIQTFDEIYFDAERDMFVFRLDYSKFARTDATYIKKWNLYSNGDRIKIFRNPQKNNEFDYETVILTEAFKGLFEQYDINWKGHDLQQDILKHDEKAFFVSLIGLISLMLQMRNNISGRTDVDYLISPVKNDDGTFYDSRNFQNEKVGDLPTDADANGAYNIARKVLWAIDQFRNAEDEELDKVKIAISNKAWLEYAQTHNR